METLEQEICLIQLVQTDLKFFFHYIFPVFKNFEDFWIHIEERLEQSSSKQKEKFRTSLKCLWYRNFN